MGTTLREIRKGRGLTQKTIEKTFGLANGMVSKWEKKICKPSLKMIPKLAELYDLSVQELINIIEN